MAGVIEARGRDIVADDDDEGGRAADLEIGLIRDGIPRPVVEDRADIMDDPQAGRVAATHFIGSRVEAMVVEQEDLEKELRHMKVGLAMGGATLEKFKERIKVDTRANKLKLKESEYALKYVQECVIILQKLFQDAEAKRLAAEGARVALQGAVDTVQTIYKDEREKLRRQEEYLTSCKLSDRPVGVNPGNPLERYKREVDGLPQPSEGTSSGPLPPPIKKARGKRKKPSE